MSVDDAPELLLFAILGVASSVINSLAGGGSLLLIPVLNMFGVATSVANGTVRLAAWVQSVSSLVTFHRRGIREVRRTLMLAPVMLVGAGIGASAAISMSDAVFKPIFGIILAIWAVILLLRPASFTTAPEEPRLRTPMVVACAALIGIYGGFVQGGVGFPLLALLVLGVGLDPIRANAVKLGLVATYTTLALPIFAQAGLIDWRRGIALAVGSIFGGWLGAYIQMRRGAELVRWFVLVAISVSAIVMISTAFR